jgi:hypothetical protein
MNEKCRLSVCSIAGVMIRDADVKTLWDSDY